MKTRNLVATVILSASLASAHAHHSISMIELSEPRWVDGTVVRFQVVAPHVMIELEERQPGSSARRWIIEGPRLERHERLRQQAGVKPGQSIVKVGDAISVCGFPLTKQNDPARMYEEWKPVDGRFLHGHVLTLPGGRMTAWGPYGKMDNCVRPSDSPQTWVQFLDHDDLAHRLWCTGKTYTTRVAAGAPAAIIQEVDRSLVSPCG